ncbi:MAG: Fe-S cluster assembly protein IscX [Anaerolineaceae bacterium]|nr:Fe-S cluster assembly protein IscX [Anaerolineaceae bacterium]
MNEISQSGNLYWDATYEIVLSLKAAYPDIAVDTVGLVQLYHYVTTLPNFVDDPRLANDGILNEILREWYEEVTP